MSQLHDQKRGATAGHVAGDTVMPAEGDFGPHAAGPEPDIKPSGPAACPIASAAVGLDLVKVTQGC